MGLEEYEKKRDFGRTPEPEGDRRGRLEGGSRRFVVQAHAARRMHWDFRLELDGVLVSWAIPKGPSLDPEVRRLAMHTEDHPLEYATFEGVIPKGEYGGGTVLVWDQGTWEPEGDPREGHDRGKLKLRLHGQKLRGRFHLVRSGGRRNEDGDPWLLIKGRDDAARPERGRSIVEERPESVITGRTLAEVRADPDRVWHPDETAVLPDVSNIEGARRTKRPARVSPQLATLVEGVARGAGWLHEIKLDGYRILAWLDRGRVTMMSRNGKDWTARMPSVVRALAALPLSSAILDGEIVVLDPRGVSDFQRLQNSLGDGRDRDVVYYVFDLLYLDGWDLRGVPLLERKRALRSLLAAVGAGSVESRIRFGDHVEGQGEAFFQHACDVGLEGVVSKRADGPYRSGRGKDWVKVKCLARQELVIGGFTDPAGSRSALGALLVGMYDDSGALRYAGKVGTGFTEESLRQVYRELEPLQQKQSPFEAGLPDTRVRGVHWVSPVKVAEIEYSEITKDGRLRHPSFKGLREDEPARSVRREAPARAPVDLTGIRLTNPNRVLYPEAGVTKKDLALYYAEVSSRILPHIAGRLLTLYRCPTGHTEGCFFQKHRKPGMSRDIRPVPVEEDGEHVRYVTVDDARGLLALVQMSVLEIHTWGSHADRLEQPDLIVMDLDPGPDVRWERVIEGALRLRQRLRELGLESFVKTTGGKGLHVVVPIEPDLGWVEIKELTRALAEDVRRREPEKYVTNMAKAHRRGRIFLDYHRNGRGASAIAPFSTRARPGAPVSAPLEWEEMVAGVGAETFTVRTLPSRLAELERDPWEGYFELRQRITPEMLRELAPGTRA